MTTVSIESGGGNLHLKISHPIKSSDMGTAGELVSVVLSAISEHESGLIERLNSIDGDKNSEPYSRDSILNFLAVDIPERFFKKEFPFKFISFSKKDAKSVLLFRFPLDLSRGEFKKEYAKNLDWIKNQIWLRDEEYLTASWGVCPNNQNYYFIEVWSGASL